MPQYRVNPTIRGPTVVLGDPLDLREFYGWFSYLQESFEDGLLHVPLAIFGLLQDELVQVVLHKSTYTYPTKCIEDRMDVTLR